MHFLSIVVVESGTSDFGRYGSEAAFYLLNQLRQQGVPMSAGLPTYAFLKKRTHDEIDRRLLFLYFAEPAFVKIDGDNGFMSLDERGLCVSALIEAFSA